MSSPIAYMDGDELSQLKAAATDYNGMLALFEKQRSVVEKQNAELAVREEASEKAVDNVKATKARVEELRNKVHRAKIDQARRLAAAPVEVTSSYKLDAASSYREHVDRLVSLATKLTAMQNHYTYFESVAKAAPDSSVAAKNVKRIDIDGVSAAEDDYPEFSVKLESLLEILAEDEKRFAEEGADITAVAALKAQAAEVTALHDRISGPMIREVSRRRYYDDSVEELRASQQRIILWCHQHGGSS